MKIVRFYAGDILTLKKPHPCGCDRFKVERAGIDVRIVCLGCNHSMTLDRLKLEKAVKTVSDRNNI